MNLDPSSQELDAKFTSIFNHVFQIYVNYLFFRCGRKCSRNSTRNCFSSSIHNLKKDLFNYFLEPNLNSGQFSRSGIF
jgi:hypothetical protein